MIGSADISFAESSVERRVRFRRTPYDKCGVALDSGMAADGRESSGGCYVSCKRSRDLQTWI